ncbi:hypothetical protein IKQ26_09935 [bacterium]|nr:hypothetical protein [bacterium]
MNNNINGDYLFKDFDKNRILQNNEDLQGFFKIQDNNLVLYPEIVFPLANESENVDGFQKSDETENKEGQAVNREDLPEGSTVKDGKIYDKDGKEIGYVEVSLKDYDGDGVQDKVEAYFLYETQAAEEKAKPEHAVAPDELPEGAVVENGKIYDAEGNEIGRIAQSVADATGDGKTDTITQYYLYDEEENPLPDGWEVAEDGTITTEDGRKVEAVNVEDLPEGYKVEDGKIFDKDGKEIGRVASQEKDTDGDGVADTVDSYYLYTEEPKPEHAVSKDELPEGYEIKDGKIFDKDGNEIGRIQESVKDVTGDGKTDSITQYFLYDEEPELPEGWEVAEDGTITTDDGRKVEAVNVEDLPEGYKVEDGKIFDKDGKEIGRVVTQEKDTDGDGVADTVDSYYLYTDEPSEYAVAKADLPEGYKIEDGKIFDKDGNEIGRTEETVEDATGDGKTDSVTKYYLYGEKPEEERTASAVNKEDLPDGATVKEGVIYDKEGNEIGYTQVKEEDTNGDGKADTVESYFLYD